MTITYEPFCFMPGHTINAIIRLKNYNADGEKLEELVRLFNEINEYEVPKLGKSYLVPIDDSLKSSL